MEPHSPGVLGIICEVRHPEAGRCPSGPCPRPYSGRPHVDRFTSLDVPQATENDDGADDEQSGNHSHREEKSKLGKFWQTRWRTGIIGCNTQCHWLECVGKPSESVNPVITTCPHFKKTIWRVSTRLTWESCLGVLWVVHPILNNQPEKRGIIFTSLTLASDRLTTAIVLKTQQRDFSGTNLHNAAFMRCGVRNLDNIVVIYCPNRELTPLQAWTLVQGSTIQEKVTMSLGESWIRKAWSPDSTALVPLVTNPESPSITDCNTGQLMMERTITLLIWNNTSHTCYCY